MSKMRIIVGLVVPLALVLVFAGSALAGPRDDQYANVVATVTKPKAAVGVAGATATRNSPSVVKAATSALPFTGLDLGLALAIGGALVGAGIVVKRAGRPKDLDS